MPRRPRKQPRTFGAKTAKRTNPEPARKTDGKIQKWVQRKDIQGDDEDQFHEMRDRIMLEGEDAEGDEEWDDGEEEVFGLDLEDDSEDDNAVNGEGVDAGINEIIEDEGSPSHNSKKTKQKTPRRTEASPSPSDSESEELESWGHKKSAYYASNAGLLADREGEEDEEEANEMEEREARRLQARMRENMEDEDYGLDELDHQMVNDELEVDKPVTVSQSISLLKTSIEHLDKATAIRHLEKTNPETLALAREWDDVVRDLMHVQQRLNKLESTTSASDPVMLGMSHLHHQILLTYVTILAFYLHIRAGLPTATESINILRVKPVLQRLLTLKQALSTLEELDFDASDEDDDDDDDFHAAYLDDQEMAELARLFGPSRKSAMKDINLASKRQNKLGPGELDALLRDADAIIHGRPASVNGVKNSKKSANGTKKQTLSSKPPTFDLVEPIFVPSKRGGTRSDDSGLEAYGEATALSTTDDLDKKARKRSLRFHTSKIETSVRRREEGRQKLGGDDDIPYRERKKEKEARVRREVAKTRGEGGDDLDVDAGHYEESGGTDDSGIGKRKRDDDGSLSEEEGEDGYYELIKRAKKERKEAKKLDYEEAQLKERVDIVEADASGPRSLTRAILKNKGLTPRRPKSVRNPRVKKRERFEKAKKKVRSQKAVYKGGLSGRPYGGEESGITKVVKSVKL